MEKNKKMWNEINWFIWHACTRKKKKKRNKLIVLYMYGTVWRISFPDFARNLFFFITKFRLTYIYIFWPGWINKERENTKYRIGRVNNFIIGCARVTVVFGSLTGAKKKKKKKKEKKLGSYIFAGNGNGMKTRRMKKSCYIHYTRYILWREWWREYRDAG